MMRTLLALIGGSVGFLLVIPIAIVGVPFWIVALLTRTLTAWVYPQVVRWPDVIQFDPHVGWKPKPSVRAICEIPMVKTFRVETDQEGMRGPSSLEDSQVVVFGDSFAFGFAVNRPYFDVPIAGLRIKAVAADGYNTVQELMVMRQHASRLHGKLVVWFIFIGNDLMDNLSPSMLGYRQPFLLESGESWEIVTKHLKPERWPAQQLFNSKEELAAVFGKNSTSDRVYSACEYLIASGQAVCREAGANLVVLTIPWMIQYQKQPWLGVNDRTFDPDLPDIKIGDICNKLGVEFIPGKQRFALRHYILNEGHLNEEGHQHLAMILSNLYQEHRVALEGQGDFALIRSSA